MGIKILTADKSHVLYAEQICALMEVEAQKRGTGIAKRKPEYIEKKMNQSQAIIALDDDALVGFSYIETWSHNEYVANSGLIVHPDYRGAGMAKAIKSAIFELSKQLFPDAKIFGITTSPAVMKINSDLGYEPVDFSQLTQDESFWAGCGSCPNYDILNRTNKKHCLCTGMLYHPKQGAIITPSAKKERWQKFKKKIKFSNPMLKLYPFKKDKS